MGFSIHILPSPVAMMTLEATQEAKTPRKPHCCIDNHFSDSLLLCAKKVYHYSFFDSVQCNPRRNKTNTVAQERSVDLQLLFLDGTGSRDLC